MIDFSRARPHPNDLIIFYSCVHSTLRRHTHSQIYSPNESQKQQFLLKVRPWALLATVTLHISGWWSSAASSPVAVRQGGWGILRAVYLAKSIWSFTSWLIMLGLKIDQQVRLLHFQVGNNIGPQAPIMPPWWKVTPKMAVIPAIIEQSELVLVIITLCSISPSDLIDLTWQFSASFSKEKSLVCIR